MAKMFPGVEILGGVEDGVPAVTREVKDGDTYSFGSIQVRRHFI